MPVNKVQIKERIKTPTVFCDGSSDYSTVDKGKFQIDYMIQIISVLILIILIIRYFIGFSKTTYSFFSFRLDIFKLPLLGPLFEKAVHLKYFSFLIRFIPALIFILVLLTGFLGREKMNLAAPLVWMFWWTLLIFMVAFGGKIFCAICPWDFFANLFQFGPVYNKNKVVIKHLKKWPKFLKSIYPAIIFFLILTWLELGFEINKNSYMTAILGLIVVMLAIAIPVWFEKRAFCRYLCPVGRISGLYAIFSPIELRVKSKETCNSCKTKECVSGNEYSSPCPMELVPFKLESNTYCTLCTECVRSCEKSNLTLKLRSFASEINEIKPEVKGDESALFFMIFSLTFFHGISMVYPWFQAIDGLRNMFTLSYLSAFTILLLVFLLVIFFAYSVVNQLILSLTKKRVSINTIAICLIPITLAYHLGHNVMHVFGEVPFLVPLISDPFGWGWNLLSLKNFTPVALLKHEDILQYQVGLMIIGFYFSIKTLRIKLNSFGQMMYSNILDYQLVYFIGASLLFFVTLFSFWLIGQPMVMRGGI